MTSEFREAALVAVDWGTSRLRARLTDWHGRVLASAASDEGIGQIDGGHEAAFERLCHDWPVVPAVMAGMVGSRQGWREAAYVPCPADIAALAERMTRFETSAGRAVAIVPGLMMARTAASDGDVIRGEETQIAGLIAREPEFAGLAILPGTHAKWVRIAGGAIASFRTFITGEMFALLSRTSFLRHSVADGGSDIAAAPDFHLGVARVVVDGIPFLSALFSVRARQLLANVDRQANLAYLSGLVIGGEIAAAQATEAIAPATPVRLVGAGSLCEAYRRALAIAGIEASVVDGDELVLGGLVRFARAAGFLPAVGS